jgi:hypothetical protein
MLSIKKLTCKKTFRQVFIRVFIQERQSVMLVFSIQRCKLLSLQSSLWFNSSSLPPFYVWISIWGSGPQTYKHLPQSPFTGQFFKLHFALPSLSLIFLFHQVKCQILYLYLTIAKMCSDREPYSKPFFHGKQWEQSIVFVVYFLVFLPVGGK